MLGFIQQLFGGSKSEKDVKLIQPVVTKVNEYFTAFQSITNDELRSRTNVFKQKIQDHLTGINEEISKLTAEAETLDFSDFNGKDIIYQEIDKLKKKRN